nr:MAG TPA: hypothetical protein [Caudoviricetes sp.]
MELVYRMYVRAIARQRDGLNDLDHSGGFCFLKIRLFHVVHLPSKSDNLL